MRAGVVTLLAFAAGCASPGRTYEALPYASLPPSAPSATTPAPSGTPQETLPSEERPLPIDLPTAFRLAGAESLAIAIARERAEEARSQAREAEASFLPVLRPRLSFFRHEGLIQDTGGAFLDIDKQNTSLGSGADLTLDFGGALFRALAARRRAHAAESGAEAAAATALLEIVERYFELLAARDGILIETDAVAQARGLLDYEEARLRLGAALEAEVARARANLAEAEGRLAEARGALRSASAALVRELHLDPSTSLVPAEGEIAPLERFAADAKASDLMARALENRPEIAEARFRLEAAESDLSGASVGPLVPRLRLEAAYGAFGENLGMLRDQEVYRAALEWDLGAALFPAKDAASSRLRQTRLGVASLQDAVAEEVVRALEESRAARERIAAEVARLAAAEVALRLADTRLRQGAGLLLEVLDAQASLTRARTERVRATASFNRAQFRLLRAVGDLNRGG